MASLGKFDIHEIPLQIAAEKLRQGLMIRIVAGIEVRDTDAVGWMAYGSARGFKLRVGRIAEPEEAGSGGQPANPERLGRRMLRRQRRRLGRASRSPIAARDRVRRTGAAGIPATPKPP